MHLWTWSGTYFGYRDGDELWTCDGRLVGRFYGDEVFGSDGRYLGEIRDSDRLITRPMKGSRLKSVFPTRVRGVPGVPGSLGSRAMPAGYCDFPEPKDVG